MIENWHILAIFCTIWTILGIVVLKTLGNIFYENISGDTHTPEQYIRPDRLTNKNPEMAWDKVKNKIAKQFLDKTMKDLKTGSMFDEDMPEGMEGILGEVMHIAKENPEMIQQFLAGLKGKGGGPGGPGDQEGAIG